MEYVHRLPFGMPRIVRQEDVGITCDSGVFQENNRGRCDVLAYKGGHFEKDLLRALEILCINLEEYGCPKVGSLFKYLRWLETCGNHIGMAYEHCPKVEVEAIWMVVGKCK
jgi:hypothetical protein